MPIVIAALLLLSGAGASDQQQGAAPPAVVTPAPDADARKAEPVRPVTSQGRARDDDEEDEHTAPLSEVVVTARRLDTARTSIDAGLGASVYELHNETIENRPGGETGSIGAILAQTPGVTLSDSGPTVRGSSAVPVHINGVLLPEAISDPADQLSSRLAESTRLITGTLPAQFGFAPGGVIAVTTKNGLYQHGGQAELFAGSHDAFEPAFEWAGSADNSSLFASGSMERSRSLVADAVGPSTTDARRETGGLAFADHVIDDDDRVSLIVGGSGARDRIGATDLAAGSRRLASGYAVGTYQHSAEQVTVQAALFAGRSTDSSDIALDERVRRSSVGTQIDASFEEGRRNTIRTGLLLAHNTSRESGSGLIPTEARRTSLGLYLQDEWKPGPRLTINAGVRGEWLRKIGSKIAVEPRVGVVWESTRGFTAHAGYARYASAPPVDEAGPLPDERDDYVDAGVQQKLGLLTVGVDAYWRRAGDLIVEHRSFGAAIPSAFAFRHGRFRGVELSATYAQGPVTAWANLSLSKSQGRTIIGGETLFPAATLAAANGRWIDLAADRPVTATGGVTWRIGRLGLSGDVLAGSGAVRTAVPSDANSARASSFATLGLAAVYHAELFDHPTDIRLDLTNLANVHYVLDDAANLEGGETRFAGGRAILIGIEQSF